MQDSPPTFRLRERSPRECRLRPDDVEFLLTHHRGHVELTPTRRRHRWTVTPGGHVGVIVAPHCRLLIRPKLALPNLLELLDGADDIPADDDRTDATAGDALLDLLAGRLARLLTERAAAGLHRAYREEAQQGPFLQGRLDVAAQLRDAGSRKDLLHCRREEFTADVPCNRVPRAAAELVLRSPLLGDAPRAALSSALRPYESVSPMSLDAGAFAAAEPDRLTEPYRPLLELCRLLADGLAPGERAGAVPCPAFLLDLERLFEGYCTRRLLRAWAQAPHGLTASAQPWHRAADVPANQPGLALRPDLTLSRGGRVVLVLDVKWKRLSRTALPPGDVHQVLAYCAALGANHAALVYPGRRARNWNYRFGHSAVSLSVHTLPVTAPAQACRAAVRRLARLLVKGSCRGGA